MLCDGKHNEQKVHSAFHLLLPLRNYATEMSAQEVQICAVASQSGAHITHSLSCWQGERGARYEVRSECGQQWCVTVECDHSPQRKPRTYSPGAMFEGTVSASMMETSHGKRQEQITVSLS